MLGLAVIITLGLAALTGSAAETPAASTSSVTSGAAATTASAPAAKPAVPVVEKPELWVEGAKDPDYVAPGAQAAIDKAVAYLRKTQMDDGSWPANPDSQIKMNNLGITSVVTLGLVKAGVPASDPMVEKALKYILGYVKADGGVHEGNQPNYITSITIMTLAATGDKKYSETIAKAINFLKDLQWTEGHGIAAESSDFGGAGYNKDSRPDLSNQQWFIQAIREAGLSPDDPAVKKALVFVQRTQGGEEARWIGLPDGGFIYSPHDKGSSKAGEIDIPAGTKLANGQILPSGTKGLKTYGSMTYAGFLSLIYAGLDRNDKRVQAALGWAQKHWTVEENPELGKQGYFYYLMTMGKALKTYGAPVIIDDKGAKHEWRKELSAKMVALQDKEGSWINNADRFMEGSKPLVTGYALITLTSTKAKL
jgi:squalene-hopene/tetraprenyl-beta-curcumene cyclase